MHFDPQTIPLHHFTGPLGYRVQLKMAPHHQVEAWSKWLRAFSTVLGLSCHARDDVLHLQGHLPEGGIPPRVQRELLAWLVGHDIVEEVVIVRQSPHPGLSIELTTARASH